jgi:hypothetical protein
MACEGVSFNSEIRPCEQIRACPTSHRGYSPFGIPLLHQLIQNTDTHRAVVHDRPVLCVGLDQSSMRSKSVLNDPNRFRLVRREAKAKAHDG